MGYMQNLHFYPEPPIIFHCPKVKLWYNLHHPLYPELYLRLQLAFPPHPQLMLFCFMPLCHCLHCPLCPECLSYPFALVLVPLCAFTFLCLTHSILICLHAFLFP
jgi:hypothetical protein